MRKQPVITEVGAATRLPSRRRLGPTLSWTLGIGHAVAILGGLAGGWLKMSFRPVFGDALFVEGALLLVLAGLLDVTRSVTAAHIWTRPRIGDPPPSIERTQRTYALVVVGVLLCLEGVLVAHGF